MTGSSRDLPATSEERDYIDSPLQAVVTLTTPDGGLIDRVELKRADLNNSELNVFRGYLGERLTEEARNHGGKQ